MTRPQDPPPGRPPRPARRRRSVSLSADSVINCYPAREGATLPLVVEPAVEGLDGVAWAELHRDFVTDKLHEHGAVLFRNFGVASATGFEAFARAVAGELYGDYGDLPRAAEGERIYGSTVYPPDETILFHNESSHVGSWPLKIFFHCAIAAQAGGETPLLDCREVYRRLDPALRERFEQQGLRYVRSFLPGLDVSWQDFFRTSQRADVEEHCRQHGMDFEWVGADELRVSRGGPAVAHHPRTGEALFFNQIQLHHPACLEAKVRQSLDAMFQRGTMPRNVTYGDGQPIEDAVVEQLGEMFWQASVAIPWQQGDVMLLDNMRVAHARNPFSGPRQILVALADMHTDTEKP